MSRRMDYTVAFDAPPEKIYQDFTSREYWQTLMDATGSLTPQSEMTSFSIRRARHRHRRSSRTCRGCTCRRSRATVMPVDMVITRKQHFDPYDHDRNRAKGTYTRVDPARPRPASAASTSSPRPTPAAQLRLASVCKVYIPFVGGALEDLILHNIKYLFDAEEAFTADWISKHH